MLTSKQIRFIDEYLIDCNATQAAIRAGYSVQTARVIGSENLLKPAIRDAIEARQRVFAEEARVTKENVLEGLQESVAMARKQLNPAVMISGWTQIAKMLGFYEPELHQVHLSGNDARLLAKYEAMSDEELLAIVSGGVS
jgi:phage terminase small subunit